MSNPDSFIAEVSEEVRRDQLYLAFRRYGWIAIALVLLLVGGAGWREYAKATAAAAAEARGDALLLALEPAADADRAAALSGLVIDGSAAAVAGLLRAADLQQTGDAAGAVLALNGVSANPDNAPLYRDLAALKALMLQTDRLDAAALKQQLSVLAAPGAPFRLLAQEQMALADLEAGDNVAALAALQAIAADAEVTASMRDRARALIVALGGQTATTPVAPETAPVE